MRPGQNKRMRGRNNNSNTNNRKGPNPLTRSYESNGPDVKIRGTAQHVAEKYLQLARDAQSSGDPVMAESYLQHAEHYFRLIAAAQQAQQQQLGFRQQGDSQAELDDAAADEEDVHDRFASPAERAQAILNQPQPNLPNQDNLFNGQPNDSNNQPDVGSRQDRGERQERGERGGRPDPRNDRNGRNNRRPQRSFDNNDSGIRQPRPIDPARTGEQPRNIEQVRNPEQERPVRAGNIEAQQDDSGDDNQPMLPSFITGGRVTRDPVTDTASQAGNKDDSEKPESPKPRRRRRPVANTIQDGDNPAAEPEADEIAAGE